LLRRRQITLPRRTPLRRMCRAGAVEQGGIREIVIFPSSRGAARNQHASRFDQNVKQRRAFFRLFPRKRESGCDGCTTVNHSGRYGEPV
jgi:hypothetical protein